MKLLTLGGLEFKDSSFQRVKPLLLLVYLSIEGRQTREHLNGLFWPQAHQQLGSKQRRNNLSRTLSDLRIHAPDSFDADKGSVWSLAVTDVTEFRHTLEMKDYVNAAKIYRGPFLDKVSSRLSVELEEWIFEWRERLANHAQEAFLNLAEQAAQQQPEEAVQHARSAFRLAEPQVDMLPRFYTLFKGHDNSMAREVNDLARGYGLILKNTSEQCRTDQNQAVKSSENTPSNLPDKGTSFVGRDIELGEITHQLLQPTCRLLNLTGMGGVGKSRLAIQAAYELLRAGVFHDGIYHVALEALTKEELILSSIADRLNLPLTGQGNALDHITRHIDDKYLLLILDNFEHLINGALLLPKLLQDCPNLKILATSRERLNLEQEWVFPVEGLTLPSKDLPLEEAQYFDAVQLFVQRARQVQLTFELTPDELPHVLKLCRLVAGSP